MDGIIRTSDRQYFKRCRELWNYTSKIRMNYEPIYGIAALDFGSAIHEGFAAYYNPLFWGMPTVQKEMAIKAFLKYLHAVEQKVKMGPLDFERDYNEQRQLGLDMLQHYFSWAPQHDNFTPIFVEVEFEVEIPGTFPNYIVYQGRIDMIVEDELGHYWIVDHKTAQQFQGTDWLALDDQCSSYAWAIQKQLGLDVYGVIYNQIRKKAPKPPQILKSGALSMNKQQDTTYDLFMQAINDGGYNKEAYEDFLSFLRANPKEFIRRPRVTYTPKQLQLVERRIQDEAFTMLNNPAIYPTPSPFNCNGCSFFRPCLAKQEGSDENLILEELYQIRKKEDARR